MSRYIDADAFYEDMCKRTENDSWRDCWAEFVAILSEQPTADVVEVVHGEWKFNDLKGFKVYDCSNCGVHMEAKFNYCPFCGADMRGGRNEQIH